MFPERERLGKRERERQRPRPKKQRREKESREQHEERDTTGGARWITSVRARTLNARMCTGRRETATSTNEDQADLNNRERVRRSVSYKLFFRFLPLCPRAARSCNGKAALMCAVRIALAALARYTSLIVPRRIGIGRNRICDSGN